MIRAEILPVKALVVHEWFSSVGGSEKVVEAMLSELPDSDVFCLWKEESVVLETSGNVRQSLAALLPRQSRRVTALPLMPLIWNLSLRTRGYDVVVVSSHAFSHQVKVPRGTPKLVYVHTPARYVWTPDMDSRGSGAITRALAAVTKPLDRRRARSATAIAANSGFVRDRIKASWGLNSSVIYPPVEVTKIQDQSWRSQLSNEDLAVLEALPETFILGASRFIDYKRLDVVIEAGELQNTPVVIAGRGPSEGAIRERAKAATVPVTVLVNPSTPLLWSLYERSQVYVFPAIEDFGIMPVEAMACGTPVVANAVGGTRESVQAGVSGSHFTIGDRTSLQSALSEALKLERDAISTYARQFSRERFQANFRDWVASHIPDMPDEGVFDALRR